MALLAPAQVHLVMRGKQEKFAKQSVDFSGIPHKLRFSTDKPIYIHGFSFAGLHAESSGNKFLLTLEANESIYHEAQNEDGYINYLQKAVFPREEVRGGEEYSLKFGIPFGIPAHTLISVGVQMDAIDEAFPVRFNPLKPEIRKRQEEHRAGVKFFFNDHTSAVTGMYFSLAKGTEDFCERPAYRPRKDRVSCCERLAKLMDFCNLV